MEEIQETFYSNTNFFRLIDYLSGEQLPKIESYDELEFIENIISNEEDYVSIEKIILFPIEKKYRGIITTILGLNKIRLSYNIQYSQEEIVITVKNPKSLSKILEFHSTITIKNLNPDIKVDKKTKYKNKLKNNPLVPKIEGDFLEKIDEFTYEMLRTCV